MASYPQIPISATHEAGTEKAEHDLKEFIKDLSERKEFRILRNPTFKKKEESTSAQRFERLRLLGFQLHGAQAFVSNLFNPDTPYLRLLINWQTGTGKTIAAISIGQEFIRQYRLLATLSHAKHPTITVVGFTREIIQEDMLRFPEFGFISHKEIADLHYLRALVAKSGQGGQEAHRLSAFLGKLRRRITDEARGGFYSFYGYREFANRLFSLSRQGVEKGIELTNLYGSDVAGIQGADSPLNLFQAIEAGDIIVNQELLDELKNGLLIADEIHNVYNMQEKNHYGVALQYALDTLDREAPRAVFMTATPMTGSAGEIVDLLSLLIPRSLLISPLKRSDFFYTPGDKAGEPKAYQKALPGAIQRIGHLSAGRVSFLLDSDIGSYPRRIFEGEGIRGVPYLQFTKCPISPLHLGTLLWAQSESERTGEIEKKESRGFSASAYSLYDMVFPNPDRATDHSAPGLFRSNEILSKLALADEKWKIEHGVVFEHGDGRSKIFSQALITGPFLTPPLLGKYSAKYAKLLDLVLDAMAKGPGKIMIYHHRVHVSGVLLIQEVMRMNGFIDESSQPIDSTLCSICTLTLKEHANATHTFMPARFITLHSELDRATLLRRISYYNSPSNLSGHQYRLLIGSKIIREGYTFRGVRYQFITSLPTDFPTLIQVLGRVVRKNSHAGLPEDQRDVKIRILVSTFHENESLPVFSPELQRYADKGHEFLLIQEVERALRRYAVDSFINFPKVTKIQNLSGSLDSLPYEPILPLTESLNNPPPKVASFEAYGYAEREVNLLSSLIRMFFKIRPVWTYQDLWVAIRDVENLRDLDYDTRHIDEGNFLLALEEVQQATGSPPTAVFKVGRFYVLANVKADRLPDIDVESYLRRMKILPQHLKKVSNVARENPSSISALVAAPPTFCFDLHKYLRETQSISSFEKQLRRFETEFLMKNSSKEIDLSLIAFGATFHHVLLQRLIVLSDKQRVTANDIKVKDLYSRFRIAVTDSWARKVASKVFRDIAIPRDSSNDSPILVGYVTASAVVLYDFEKKIWYSATHSDFAIGRRQQENEIVVGVVVSENSVLSRGLGQTLPGGMLSEGSALTERVRFKIRPPIQKLHSGSGDARLLVRGAVCETRTREELKNLAMSLRKHMQKLDPASVERHPPPSLGSAGELCNSIRQSLLFLEMFSRNKADGMVNGPRFLYLFNDQPPSLTALVGRTKTSLASAFKIK